MAAVFGWRVSPFSGASTASGAVTASIILMAPCRPSQPLAKDGQHHHADFIERFTQRQTATRIAKQPETLTAAQHAALREQLKDVHFLIPEYADNTKINIAGMLRKWKTYCESVKLTGHWRDVMKEADRAMAMDFLYYLCETYRIKSWGTSWEYFRQYKQLYASVTGHYMDRNDSKEILKDVADSGDLLALLTFNIAYDTGIFSGAKHRIQLAGCYLGLAFTGARPAEFVDGERKSGKDRCLEELFPRRAMGASGEDKEKAPDENSELLEELLAQEHIIRGRSKALCYEDILLIVVRHPDTGKDVLAISIKFIYHKGVDNKPKPTIFFFTPTRKLIFCLISIIISLAVHDNAFAASNLISARQVFQVKNQEPVKCTPLRWKDEWLKRPVFRRCNNSFLKNEPDDSVASKYQPLQYYKLRDDMAQQSLDSGCEKVIEPKAWRRGAANSANGSQYRIKGTKNEERIRELIRLIATKKAQRDKTIRREYRAHHFHNRPTWDIERQANGGEEEVYVEPTFDLPIPEHAQLAKILCNQLDDLSPSELLEYCIQAVESMICLCGKREIAKPKRILYKALADIMVKEESPGPDSFLLVMHKKQCLRCIGNENLFYDKRIFTYSRILVMWNHFDAKHAKQLSST
ncbi:hypothetical protein M406DRAFT_336858 [Cryphonectria parasitica EP155]|uniref:Uncharacterized protein n=1 Tax=Cryphonectria parasitica (strain ATCC 38755 / EP155) TaxID=660469 RepID=A0A9P4Y8A2_CRYP1|nr:uncharacterized protein M406DRAFT_336858 [Cryphonectria parasitica EP155]KAF3768192.1 hypothetical protein M406DRAFT_336858 [Cryphonectria parasitica EP155]